MVEDAILSVVHYSIIYKPYVYVATTPLFYLND